MKNFFSNIWTKRVVSVVSAFYAYLICYLCYCSFFYTIDIKSNIGICLLGSGISLLALVAMLYTRKQIITRVVSMILVPALLPVILFYFGEWYMIIPLAVTAIAIFLLSGAGEGMKTAFGTIFLLLYIFGSLGYFLATSLFASASQSQQILSGASKTGMYRYYVINTKDSSNGSTAIYIEPNNADKSYKYVDFHIKNMTRRVKLERPVVDPAKTPITLDWQIKTRQEITGELNAVSNEIVVHLSEKQLKMLGYTYNEKLILCDLTARQYNSIGKERGSKVYLDELSAEQLALFKLAKDSKGYYVPNPDPALLKKLDKKSGPVYIKDMNAAWKAEYNVEKDDSVLLSSLSDQNLADLGVPDAGDVLFYNGSPCFRYYVAILENYFDLEHKKITLF